MLFSCFHFWVGFTTYNRNITHFLVYLLFNRNIPFRWDNSSLFKDYKLNYSIFAVQWIKWSKIVRFCNESTKLAGTFYGRERSIQRIASFVSQKWFFKSLEVRSSNVLMNFCTTKAINRWKIWIVANLVTVYVRNVQ